MRTVFLRVALIIVMLLWCHAGHAQDAPVEQEPAKAKEWKLKPPKLSGYVQVFYRHAWDTSNDGVVDAGNFRVQRVRIELKGEILPWVTYDVEVDPRAPEVTGILRDAFIGLKVIPHHTIRIGQQKTQFGYENRASSSQLYVVNRSELSDSLSRGINLRDIGIGLIGNVPLGKRWRIEDAITVVNGTGLNVQADDTPRKNVWGRLGLRYKSDDLTARLGLSAANGDQKDLGDNLDSDRDDFVFKFDRQGADLELDQRWFFLATEYVKGRDDIPRRPFPRPATPAEVVDSSGYYGLVAIKTPWKAGPLVRYESLDVAAGEFKRWTYGAFWGLPDDPVRLLLNYERRALRDGVRADDKFYVWLQVRF